MTLCLALRLDATQSPLCAEVAAQLTRIAQACATQSLRDVAPQWGCAVNVRAVTADNPVGATEAVFGIEDVLPADPQAEAYHTEVSGRQVAYDALDDAQTLADLTASVSHEVVETQADPSVNRSCNTFAGWEYALEIADPVESNSYPIDLADGGPPVMVSDFVYPSFFDPWGQAPYCYCQDKGLPGAYPAGPFQVASGGYAMRRPVTVAETQADGRTVQTRTVGPAELVGTPSARRQRRIARASSRVGRRAR